MHVSNAMDPSEWTKQKQQRPVRRSLYGALRKESNVKCLILTALIYGCIIAIIWCRITRVTKVDIDFTAFPITSTREISPCDDGSIYIPTAFVVMLYLLYLVECWYCRAWNQLKFEKTDLNSAYQKIHEVRHAQPVVWWKAVCYHYVRRTREITRYRNGNAYTCSQVFYERVNSHVAAGCFFFALCGMKDVSRELIDLEKYAATKIQLSKGFLFANLATAREFQEQRAAFFQEQERHDDYMEMREGMDLSNVHFKESLISWASPDNPPWFAKIPVFWLCNFLLLSWPLRLILELNTAHVHYQVNKLFGVNYMSPSGSELLLSAPRSHYPPINNHQYRIHNRAISSHHSRLNPYNNNGGSNRRRRSTVLPSDQEETAPLLLNSNDGNSPQLREQQQSQNQTEKDELSSGSFKNLNKDQQQTQEHQREQNLPSLNNNDNLNSTTNNNDNTNTSPSSSSSGRIFFPQWRSSFFSRNFRFSRQTGYKLTRSVTLLMTKPERMEFLQSTQPQFPDEFGYYGDSDEGARLLHDESYYPSCSSPPPPPFLTPSPEEEEEEDGEGGNGNSNSRITTSTSATILSHNHNSSHQYHHGGVGMMSRGGGNTNSFALAPSYSQALLWNEQEQQQQSFSNPSTSNPAENLCDSSTSPNFTNEHRRREISQNGFANVSGGISNDFEGNNSGTILVDGSTSARRSSSTTGEAHYDPSRREDNCPTGTTGNPPSSSSLDFGNQSLSATFPNASDCNDHEGNRGESREPLLGNRHVPHQQQQQQQPCSSSSSMSSVTGHYQRASTRLANAGSSLVLNTVAPREVTGVQIDLTQPIVITVPRDPLRESGGAVGGSSSSTTASSSSSQRRATGHYHQHVPFFTSGGGDDEPPNYFEALRTSRPVFLPTLARIRRCFTERDIASRFSSKRSHWLDEITDMEGATTTTSATGSGNRNHHQQNPSGNGRGGAGNSDGGVGSGSGSTSTSRV